MINNKIYRFGIILFIGITIFAVFPTSVLLAQAGAPIIIETTSEDDDPAARIGGRFEDIIKFMELFSYEGVVEHEHEHTFWGGGSSFYGRGIGTLSGLQTALEKESIMGRTYSSAKSYFVHTYPGLARAESMGAVSSFSVHNRHSGTLGVRPNPGEDASIKSNVDYSRDQDGEYFRYGSTVNNSDGTTRISTDTGNSETTAEVEGSASYREVVIVDKGGTKTGWWDLD